MDCIVVHPTLAAPLQLPEALFLKCTCIPPPPPPTRARPLFFVFLPSPLHHTTEETMKQRFAGEGFTLIPFTDEGEKKGIPFTHKIHCINKLWVKVKAGIANSLSARCPGTCPFARTEVQMRKKWAT